MQNKIRDINHWTSELLTQAPLLLDKIQSNTHFNKKKEAIEGVNETLRFLHLCSLSSASLTPSQHIDEVWHEFILFTQTYHLFCEEKLGQFIHHQPSNDQKNVINQYQKTLKLYKTHFGEPNRIYWPIPDQDVAACGPCETHTN